MDIQLWDRRLRVCHRKLLQRCVNENAQGVISFEVCRVMPRARFFSVGRGPSTTRELWVWQIRFQQQKAQIRTQVCFREQMD